LRKGTIALALVLVGALVVAVQLRDPVDDWHTLASLRKVDDHPLYVMRYYGDYDWDEEFTAAASTTRGKTASPWHSDSLWSCTCFAALGDPQEILLGRNFDWYPHAALLLFTHPPNGYASVSMVDISYLGLGAKLPSWSERRQLLLAPRLPFDGMNERGLGVGMMAVPFADSGRDPERVTLDSLQVIRLLLDQAADVEEAIALLGGCNIDFGQGPPVHYLLVDAQGRSAVAEFVAGEMRVLWNSQPWQVATNFVISTAIPEGSTSECWRYNFAYETLAERRGAVTAEEAMQLLDRVSQRSTIWSLVYHLCGGGLDVAMGRDYGAVYRYKL